MPHIFSSAHAKSCETLLLWAHILGVTIARTVVVDDSETDKIIYSKEWISFRRGTVGNQTCSSGCSSMPHIYNDTWHAYVGYNSDG